MHFGAKLRTSKRSAYVITWRYDYPERRSDRPNAEGRADIDMFPMLDFQRHYLSIELPADLNRAAQRRTGNFSQPRTVLSKGKDGRTDLRYGP